MRVLVLFGVCVAIVTETLGALHRIERAPLLIVWFLIFAAGVWRLARRYETLRPG